MLQILQSEHDLGRSLPVLLAVALFSWQPACAQSEIEEVGAVTVGSSSRFVIEAQNVDEIYQIDVAQVGAQIVPLEPGQTLPVIYVLDGSQFHIVTSVANLLAASRLSGAGQGIPQVLVVAVGYVPDPSLSPLENQTNTALMRRHRDYTPELDPEWVATQPDLPPHGGAANFRAFIEAELKPFIASRYPVDREDQTIIGHSMAGLFVIDTLLRSPESFDRYIASSPGLAWGDFRPLGDEISFDDGNLETPSELFISAGGLEEADMIGTAAAMSQTLKENSANVDVTFQLILDEDHISVIPGAMTRGLQEVFN